MTTNLVATINYEKRKNTELFKSFQESKDFSLSALQNYMPIYNKFFSLNANNFNAINLNNKFYMYKIKNLLDQNSGVYSCLIKNTENDQIIEKNVFFKFAPLIDPYKFLIGKYNINDEALYTLPKLTNALSSVHPKILDENNSSYVDSFFSFLSSKLIHHYHFINGVDYYGSFLGIKNNLTVDIIEDIDYLNQSDFFLKNKNVFFTVDDYSFLINKNEKTGLKPIVIDHSHSNKSALSLHSISEQLYDDIFIDDSKQLTQENLREHTLDLVDVTTELSVVSDNKTTTIKSGSTCSSRTSHTSDDNTDTISSSNEDSSIDSSSSWESESSSGEFEDQVIVTIPRFPVNIICMESCKKTFDSLIANENLTHDEWFSSLMQIIMILITYQKCFSFTHNDLHTNNIMYIETDKKYIYYCYNKKYYKVPTFGRIFKIIDFGRSIYKFNGKVICSDSFQSGSDAATQYNTEPYFNEKKPRLEPNYSFDLCRLACSIFDYVIDDLDEIEDISKAEPIVKLIYEWCLDDNGLNILYKNNGVERYPDFKLYKMIARCVHKHTPQNQLDRSEFAAFQISKKDIRISIDKVINLDEMPNLAIVS